MEGTCRDSEQYVPLNSSTTDEHTVWILHKTRPPFLEAMCDAGDAKSADEGEHRGECFAPYSRIQYPVAEESLRSVLVDALC